MSPDLVVTSLFSVDIEFADCLRHFLLGHPSRLGKGMQGSNGNVFGVYFKIAAQCFPGVAPAETVRPKCDIGLFYPGANHIRDSLHEIACRNYGA